MENKYSLKNSVVAFIDILGYKELISACNEDIDRLNTELNNLLDAINSSSLFLEKHKNEIKRHLKTFSDNFLIHWEIENKDSDIEIGFSILDLVNFQTTLTLNGFFIRGGISIANSYINDYIIFGPGIINAHKLESEFAINPRIILDDKAINQVLVSIKGNKKLYEIDEIILQKLILKDKKDGYYFVNYLSYVLLAKYEKDHLENAIYMLNNHKDKINIKIKQTINSPKLLSKYVWVAKYHNYFCKSHYPSNPELIFDGYEADFE